MVGLDIFGTAIISICLNFCLQVDLSAKQNRAPFCLWEFEDIISVDLYGCVHCNGSESSTFRSCLPTDMGPPQFTTNFKRKQSPHKTWPLVLRLSPIMLTSDAVLNSQGHVPIKRGFDELFKLSGRIVQKGGNFMVFQSQRRTPPHTHVAVKIYLPQRCDRLQVEEELRALRAVSEGAQLNVMRMLDSFQTDVATYIVLELVQGSDLLRYFVTTKEITEFYSEKLVRHRVREMLLAMRHIHKRDVIHRNIKPSSFVLTRNYHDATLKLTDFSMAIRVSFA